MSQASEGQPDGEAGKVTGYRGVLEFATKNFGFVSATLAALGYLIGTVFLYAYLSFFDWRLIWLVEYSDILKFGIVAFAALSSFSLLLWMFAEDTARLHKQTGRRLVIVLVVFGLMLSINAGMRIAHEYRTYRDPQYTFWIFTFFAPFAVFATILILARSVAYIKRYSIPDAVGDVVMVLSTVSVLDLTFAVWVRDNDGFEQDVTVNGQLLEKVGVVFVSSHHTVLYGNQLTTVVPTASISRIQARPSVPRARYTVKEPATSQPPPSKKEPDSQTGHSD